MSGDIQRYNADQYLPAKPVMERICQLLRSALGTDAKDAPHEKILEAAMACAKYDLVPGKDAYIYKLGGKHTLDIGYYAYTQSAKRWERANGDQFGFIAERPLEDDELRAALGEQYNENACGIEVEFARMSTLKMQQMMGRTLSGSKYRGYFYGDRYQLVDEWEGPRGNRRRTGRKIWRKDVAPNTSPPLEVARRRAKKHALMHEIGLVEPPRFERNPAAGWAVLSTNLEPDEENGALLAEKKINREPNGDILFPDEFNSEPDGPIEGEFRPIGDPADSAGEPEDIGEDSAGAMPHQVGDTGKAFRHFMAVGSETYGDKWDEKRHEFCKAMGVESSKDLTVEQIGKLIAGMTQKAKAA